MRHRSKPPQCEVASPFPTSSLNTEMKQPKMLQMKTKRSKKEPNLILRVGWGCRFWAGPVATHRFLSCLKHNVACFDGGSHNLCFCISHMAFSNLSIPLYRSYFKRDDHLNLRLLHPFPLFISIYTIYMNIRANKAFYCTLSSPPPALD